MSFLSKIKPSLSICISLILIVTASGLALTYCLRLGRADEFTLLYRQVYMSAQRTSAPVLVVILHGDAPFNKPTYQYRLAQQVAQQNRDVVAVGLLRPGYTDLSGHYSAGQRGWTTGDNYTPAIVKAVAFTIQDLKKRYHPRKIVLAGHSGGSVLAADLVSQYPGLVQAALLVSCPCDVDAFRAHMAHQQGNVMWRLPVKRLSPVELVNQVGSSTQINLVTGQADSIALPIYTYRYASLLRKRGVSVTVEELANEGHEVFLSPEVLTQLRRLIGSE